jgi:hypothetical protein
MRRALETMANVATLLNSGPPDQMTAPTAGRLGWSGWALGKHPVSAWKSWIPAGWGKVPRCGRPCAPDGCGEIGRFSGLGAASVQRGQHGGPAPLPSQ